MAALATLQIPAHPIQMKVPPISDQEGTQHIRIDLTSHKKQQEMTDYARAQQLIPVVGRLHMKEHIDIGKRRFRPQA